MAWYGLKEGHQHPTMDLMYACKECVKIHEKTCKECRNGVEKG